MNYVGVWIIRSLADRARRGSLFDLPVLRLCPVIVVSVEQCGAGYMDLIKVLLIKIDNAGVATACRSRDKISLI